MNFCILSVIFQFCVSHSSWDIVQINQETDTHFYALLSDKYISIQIEWDMIVVTLFFTIFETKPFSIWFKAKGKLSQRLHSIQLKKKRNIYFSEWKTPRTSLRMFQYLFFFLFFSTKVFEETGLEFFQHPSISSLLFINLI